MAYPPQHREPPGVPSIIIPTSDLYRRHPFEINYSSSPALPIPGMASRDEVPPPLPPPRVLPMEGAPINSYGRPLRREEADDHSTSASSGGYESLESRFHERRDYSMRDKYGSVSDEGYSSYASTDRSRDSFPTEFGLFHNKLQLPSPADVHSDSMKKMLDPIRVNPSNKSPPPRSLFNSLGHGAHRASPHEGQSLPPPLSVPMQLPYHNRGAAVVESPLYSAASSASLPFSSSRSAGPRHSPKRSMDLDLSPRSSKASRQHHATESRLLKHDHNSTMEESETDDASGIKRLHIDDAYLAGHKRRVASIPNERPANHGYVEAVPYDASHGGRTSPPTPRLAAGPHGMVASPVLSRNSSYMSTVPSSQLGGRHSPDRSTGGGASPTSSSHSPYASTSLNPSPKMSSVRGPSLHSRNPSSTSPRKMSEMSKPNGHKLQGFFMCECCPKKPKKFETRDELSIHEAEKQYECAYCGNRFKNKNEAERHQNSLHVRRHSWSCSALSVFDRAFHDSPTHPGHSDVCGYCGDEFTRTGNGQATEQDWDERIRHLQEVHKFRECNSSKKFFRADHFRQHLKHSHAGTSGKWTNMLENACMIEEDPTPR